MTYLTVYMALCGLSLLEHLWSQRHIRFAGYSPALIVAELLFCTFLWPVQVVFMLYLLAQVRKLDP